MTLKEHIDEIRNQLKEGAFATEAAVSFGIVLRLLEPLGWPKFTPQVIIPEFAVEGQRVDFALCDPPKKPIVFVEVKQVGNLDGAEEQLFGYAYREGVPIAILTDGQKWRFFYPAGQGKFRERKVYELDLIESDSEESVGRLNRYLNFEAVKTGNAIKAIEEDYRNASKQREIEARLPEFWNELLQDKNEDLLLAVMEKAKSKVGYVPTEEQVLTFLKSLEKKTESDRIEIPPQPEPNQTPSNTKKPQQKLIVTMPDGTFIDHHKALDTFIEVLEKLGLEKVAQNYSRIVSTTPFHHGRHIQRGNFYIDKNHGGPEKKRHLEKIANLLNVTLKIELVDKV